MSKYGTKEAVEALDQAITNLEFMKNMLENASKEQTKFETKKEAVLEYCRAMLFYSKGGMWGPEPGGIAITISEGVTMWIADYDKVPD